jgi:hypothetical protein
LYRPPPCFVIPGLTSNPGFPMKTGTRFYTFLVPSPMQGRGLDSRWSLPRARYGAGVTLCLVNYRFLSTTLPDQFRSYLIPTVFKKYPSLQNSPAQSSFSNPGDYSKTTSELILSKASPIFAENTSAVLKEKYEHNPPRPHLINLKIVYFFA